MIIQTLLDDRKFTNKHAQFKRSVINITMNYQLFKKQNITIQKNIESFISVNKIKRLIAILKKLVPSSSLTRLASIIIS